MTRIILVLWVLALLQHSAWADWFCQMSDFDYDVFKHVVLLPEDDFTRENLIDFFSGYAKIELEGEMYVMATSDRGLYQRAMRGGRGLWSQEPTAHYYRIGSNAFFQYRNATGQTEWVVLRGESLFDRKFGEARVIFLGEDITSRAHVKRCETFNRNLKFLVENPSEDSLKLATRFYAGLFSGWERLSIWIWEWDIGAVVVSNVKYPNLDYLDLYERKKELASVYMEKVPSGEVGWVSHYDRMPSGKSYLSIRNNAEDVVEETFDASSGWP